MISRFTGSVNRSCIDLKTLSKTISNCGSLLYRCVPSLEGFLSPQIDQHRAEFRDRCLEGVNIGLLPLREGSLTSRTSLPRTLKGVLIGLQVCSQVDWRTRNEGSGDWCLDSDVLWAVGSANSCIACGMHVAYYVDSNVWELSKMYLIKASLSKIAKHLETC